MVRQAINNKSGFAASRPVRLALLYQDTAFGQGVQKAVNNTITNNNLNIQLVTQQSLTMGESDFRTPLTAIKAANPDVVYLAAFPNEGAPAITQARRDIGLNTIFLNVENNDNAQFYKDLGQYTAKGRSSRAGSPPTLHRPVLLPMPRTPSSRATLPSMEPTRT